MRVFSFVSASTASMSSLSFSGSTLAVASSRMMTGASFMMARAMDILCFSPPESVAPPSPIIGRNHHEAAQAALFPACQKGVNDVFRRTEIKGNFVSHNLEDDTDKLVGIMPQGIVVIAALSTFLPIEVMKGLVVLHDVMSSVHESKS